VPRRGGPRPGAGPLDEVAAEAELAVLAARLRTAVWTLAVLALFALPFFVWYAPIANSRRFVLPLVPSVLLTGLGGLAYLLRRRVLRPPDAGAARAGVALAVGLVAAAGLATGEWRAPADVAASDRENNAEAIALLAYLDRTAAAPETIVWGPGSLATWPLHGRVTFSAVPEGVEDPAALAAQLARVGARRLVLAPDMVERRPGAFAPYFSVADEVLRFERLPPGWRLLWRVPEDGCRYCVFEVAGPEISSGSDRGR
jgi:hypothetical protein